MQTKKRAKSVSFAKPKDLPSTVEKEVEKKETPEPKVTSPAVEPVVEKEVEEKTPEAKPVADSTEALPKDSKEDKKEEAKKEDVKVEPLKEEEKNEPEEAPIVLPSVKDVPEVKAEPEKTPEEQTKEEALPSEAKSEVKEEVEVKEEKPAISVTEKEEKVKTEDESMHASSFFNESPSGASTAPTRKKRGGYVGYFMIVAFVAFVLGLGVMAGVTYTFKNISIDNLLSFTKSMSPVKEEPTPTPSKPAATPTEKEVDLSAHTITLLNGSGISGQASKLKTKLTAAGFTISSTGNADLDDYTKTQIRAKKTVSEDFLNKLEATLKKDYALDSRPGLPPTGEVDVIVVIGSEAAK